MLALPVTEPVSRALIVRTSHLGDVAQTLPLVHALRERWPGIELGWVIQKEFAPLIEPLARPLLFERRGGAGAWPRLRRAMRDFAPGITLDAQGNWKSAFAARLSGAAAIGFPRSDQQEPLASRLLRIRASASSGEASRRRHLVERVEGLARAVTGARGPLRRDPALTERESAAGERLLAGLLQGCGRPGARPILLHPGVPGDPRTWPAARFGEVARNLCQRPELAPVIVTGPGEAASGQRLESDLADASGVAHLVGQRGLRELAGLLSAARDAGGALVVSDSGPAHLAAAVGLSVHLVAGPEDPSATGPWPLASTAGSPHRLVAPPDHWNEITAQRGTWWPRPVETTEVRHVITSLGGPLPAGR